MCPTAWDIADHHLERAANDWPGGCADRRVSTVASTPAYSRVAPVASFIESGSFGVSSDFSLKESPLARIFLTLHLYWMAVVEILSLDLDRDHAEGAWPGRPW